MKKFVYVMILAIIASSHTVYGELALELRSSRWHGIARLRDGSVGYEVLISLKEDERGTYAVHLEARSYNSVPGKPPEPIIVKDASVAAEPGFNNGITVVVPVFGRVSFPPVGSNRLKTWAKDSAARDWYLSLRRSSFTSLSPLPRPQLQSPPSWASEVEIAVDRGSGLTLSGSLFVPQGDGPFPTVICVQGSLPERRQWTNGLSQVIASDLASSGVATLFFDDRGVGKSTGLKSATTYNDSADDVRAFANRLAKQPAVDRNRIGLLGVSEGAEIVAIAGSSGAFNRMCFLACPMITEEDYFSRNAIVNHESLLKTGAKPTQKDKAALILLIKKCIRSAARTNFSADDVAKDVISDALLASDETWDHEKLYVAMTQVVNSIRSRSKRELSSLLHDNAKAIMGLQQNKIPILIVLGTHDRNPTVLDPESAKSILGKFESTKIVTLSITHSLQDNDELNAELEFDISQTISPRLLSQMSSWFGKDIRTASTRSLEAK